MTEANRLDAAFARFERALGQFELAAQSHVDTRNGLQTLAGNADSVKIEQDRLRDQLNLVQQKAAELVDTSKQAAGKIDTAMGRIRSVLHSNSGA